MLSCSIFSLGYSSFVLTVLLVLPLLPPYTHTPANHHAHINIQAPRTCTWSLLPGHTRSPVKKLPSPQPLLSTLARFKTQASHGLVGCCPVHRKFTSLMPGQGTCSGWGVCRKQPVDVSLSFPLSLPSLSKAIKF